METELEIIVKLAISLVVAGFIGLEREITGHQAGLRTQILVGLGSCTFVMIGLYSDAGDESVTRIIQGIATGLGFLGAGAIIKEGINVKGLTTAASIWVTAALGVAIGMGMYEVAITAFAFTIIVLFIFALFERWFDLKPTGGTLRVGMEEGSDSTRKVISTLKRNGVLLRRTELEKGKKGDILTMDLNLRRGVRISKIIQNLHTIENVQSVEWEEMDEVVLENVYARLKH